ncbi:MAG: T9SS type A sorting domain-containing protein, partial [Parafilimonas sp.]
DWASISNYTFTNIAPALENYVLRSADKNHAAGWALNKQYNWQYLHDNGSAPSPVSGASIIIPGLTNGNYSVKLYSCSTGAITSTVNATVTNGTLSVALPSVGWDVAFTAENQSVLPVIISKFYGEQQSNQNILHIEIAQSENVKNVLLERSSDGIHFVILSNVSAKWAVINGDHVYTDVQPLTGNNFYRLNVIDNDGKESVSNIVLLINNKSSNINFYPNPFKSYVMMKADDGKYSIIITDVKGRNLFNNSVNASGSDIKILLPDIAQGIYYISVKDENGNIIQKEKIVKQ